MDLNSEIAETDGTVDIETGFLAALVSSVSDQNHLPNAESSSSTGDLHNGVMRAMLESLEVETVVRRAIREPATEQSLEGHPELITSDANLLKAEAKYGLWVASVTIGMILGLLAYWSARTHSARTILLARLPNYVLLATLVILFILSIYLVLKHISYLHFQIRPSSQRCPLIIVASSLVILAVLLAVTECFRWI